MFTSHVSRIGAVAGHVAEIAIAVDDLLGRATTNPELEAPERVCEWGDGVQWPNDMKPIRFFTTHQTTRGVVALSQPVGAPTR